MSNVVYSKEAEGKIKLVSTVEHIFDIEEVKKQSVKIEEDIKKNEEEYKRTMTMLLSARQKVKEILAEAEKLGVTVNQSESALEEKIISGAK